MKRIELLEPHEHAGREYPTGTVLTLSDADADWLMALEKAALAPAADESTQDKEHAA